MKYAPASKDRYAGLRWGNNGILIYCDNNPEGEIMAKVTKSVFMKQSEDLIQVVELEGKNIL